MTQCNHCGDDKQEGEEIGPTLFYCTECLSSVDSGYLKEKEVEKGEQFGYE